MTFRFRDVVACYVLMNRGNSLLIFVASVVFLSGCGRQAPVEARQDSGPVQVRVAPVSAREIQRAVETVGTLFPYDEAIISAEIDGRVDEVKVDLGDAVVANQVLAHINDEEQRYLLAQNEAQLRQTLERLGLKNENDKVKDIRQTPDVRRAEADLIDAEQRHKRTSELVKNGIGSPQDLDQAVARLNAARATYDATLNQTRDLIQQVERNKAALELQRKKLRDTSIRAPFASHVKERQVTVGQYVQPKTPVFTLVKTDPIRLRAEVPERMAPWIRVNQQAEVTLEAFGDRKFYGKIWRISPTVDQSKRTFIVEVLIQNPNDELKPGSYAKARVVTNHVERVTFVPVKAVNYIYGANKAYVVKGDAVEAREVKLGDRFDENVEIVEGLREGERVAVSQLARLDTGVKISVNQ
jgi:RND family efflux transporter MFP subunit